MTTQENNTAASSACRSVGTLESVGRRIGRSLPALPFRQTLKSGFHRLLDWSSAGKGFRCDLPDGESVRILTQFRHLSWNVDELRAFKASLLPGGVALDIGANLGCYTMVFGRWVGPQGKVFAFEPAAETFDGLCEHIKLNELSAVVEPARLAVSAMSGEVSFSQDGFSGGNHIVTDDDADYAVRVPCVSVDDFCSQHRIQPGLIKIDVEGFELSVLQGARETIASNRGRLGLFVEMHPTTWLSLGISKEDVQAELEAQSLRAKPLTQANDPWSVEGCCMQLLPA